VPPADIAREAEKAKVGILGIGLAAYWTRCQALNERLEGYQRRVEERVGEWAPVVSSFRFVPARRPAAAPGQSKAQVAGPAGGYILQDVGATRR